MQAVELGPPHAIVAGLERFLPGTRPPPARRHVGIIEQRHAVAFEHRRVQVRVIRSRDDHVRLPYRRKPIAATESRERLTQRAHVRRAFQRGAGIAPADLRAERRGVGQHAKRLLVGRPGAQPPVVALENKWRCIRRLGSRGDRVSRDGQPFQPIRLDRLDDVYNEVSISGR